MRAIRGGSKRGGALLLGATICAALQQNPLMLDGMQTQPDDVGVVTLKAALELGVVVTARYNGTRIKLAPHMIYLRHGAPHLAALNLTRLATRKFADRLSVFRISGLSELQLSPERAVLKPDLLETIEHGRDQVVAVGDFTRG